MEEKLRKEKLRDNLGRKTLYYREDGSLHHVHAYLYPHNSTFPYQCIATYFSDNGKIEEQTTNLYLKDQGKWLKVVESEYDIETGRLKKERYFDEKTGEKAQGENGATERKHQNNGKQQSNQLKYKVLCQKKSNCAWTA